MNSFPPSSLTLSSWLPQHPPAKLPQGLCFLLLLKIISHASLQDWILIMLSVLNSGKVSHIRLLGLGTSHMGVSLCDNSGSRTQKFCTSLYYVILQQEVLKIFMMILSGKFLSMHFSLVRQIISFWQNGLLLNCVPLKNMLKSSPWVLLTWPHLEIWSLLVSPVT